jgi:ABC-2 type transport system permease protein
VALSLFPPTAPTTMMLRLSGSSTVIPPWQIGASVVLLAAAALFSLLVSARIFRVGLLLYGKAPSLPEIARWVRQR